MLGQVFSLFFCFYIGNKQKKLIINIINIMTTKNIILLAVGTVVVIAGIAIVVTAAATYFLKK
jgi:hypothetical protein